MPIPRDLLDFLDKEIEVYKEYVRLVIVSMGSSKTSAPALKRLGLK